MANRSFNVPRLALIEATPTTASPRPVALDTGLCSARIHSPHDSQSPLRDTNSLNHHVAAADGRMMHHNRPLSHEGSQRPFDRSTGRATRTCE